MTDSAARHPGGFTLVETLVAGIILSLSAVALGLIVRQATRSLTLARDYQQAAELLDRTLTKIDLMGPAKLLAEGPTAGRLAPPHERFQWNAAIAPLEEGDLYEVTVRITWRSAAGALLSTDGQTFLNDPQEQPQNQLQWDEL